MYTDGSMNFAKGQALSGTNADQVSTNVFDAGSAKKLFAGSGGKFKIAVGLSTVGGTTPNFRARVVAADNAALTTNPEILADTGTSKTLAASDLPLVYELHLNDQKAAKQFYGVLFTMAGHATDNTGTVFAQGVEAAQSNLLK